MQRKLLTNGNVFKRTDGPGAVLCGMRMSRADASENHFRERPSRCECTAQNQIYPILGDKVVGNITAADIKNLLNHYMIKGLSYSTVKKVYVLLNEYFRTMYLEEMINKNPMDNVEMIKKANFLSAQGKENLPECETVTILNSDELKKFKKEICATYSNGVRKHQ